MVAGSEEIRALKEARIKRIKKWNELAERIKKCKSQNPTMKNALIAERFKVGLQKVSLMLNDEVPPWYEKDMEKMKTEESEVQGGN